MPRSGDSKSWITGSAKQEQWAQKYLRDKNIDITKGLAQGISRATLTATGYLKSLNVQNPENRLLLQQASSAWRVRLHRSKKKNQNIAISEKAYGVVSSLAKASNISLKYASEVLIQEAYKATELNQQVTRLEGELEDISAQLLEQDELIEELECEVNALKATIAKHEASYNSSDKSQPKPERPPSNRELRLKPNVRKFADQLEPGLIEKALKRE